MYHSPPHTGFAHGGVVAKRPMNGNFNPYLPAMDYGGYGWTRGAGLRQNLSDSWTNWRTKRTTKKAAKWGGRAEKWTGKQAEQGLAPMNGGYGPGYDPGMAPNGQVAGMGAISPGMAIGGVVALVGMVGLAMYLAKD
jgi:hypothetical protein